MEVARSGYQDIVVRSDNMSKKDDSNSVIPATITIFSDANSARVAQRVKRKEENPFWRLVCWLIMSIAETLFEK